MRLLLQRWEGVPGGGPMVATTRDWLDLGGEEAEMGVMGPEERYREDAWWGLLVDQLVRAFKAYECGKPGPTWRIEDACKLAAHKLSPTRWPKPQ